MLPSQPELGGPAEQVSSDVEALDEDVRRRQRSEAGGVLPNLLKAVDDPRNPVRAEIQEREERADEHHLAD